MKKVGDGLCLQRSSLGAPAPLVILYQLRLYQMGALLLPAKEYEIVVVGLDNTGKTTTLYKYELRLGEVVTTHPTVGSNVGGTCLQEHSIRGAVKTLNIPLFSFCLVFSC
ncbi:uncharacterized protein LOC120011772 [Tripterygium wilfordii]|uniref:uncharacterized protein LOC120011772 n=1 Tax=Tripterygium wilfordii TaxID=458696 RepID=UPI0018F81062|nr:uncharacterized protein LOC120011772 [Tripterygium wilfordii]